ncbi:acid-activated periplasmic chaperone HdeA [Achromobacter sp. JUb104]|uniref:acid-activated periplasmic chaperone HdeA n=1 Tax=Achromobacter sp. JUb104 TaxID=2940590 RepID=UPI0021699DE4|nr:acid-activated periplasmic chaperone HdeA [Achromobacter sp. JUb104]MCS3509269.1 acid stress chaperone HdeA [Achromobacter sp. JUb104]
MKKPLLIIGLIGSLAFSGISVAADAKKPLALWECQDFLGVQESYRPIVVSYAEALNNKNKPEDAVLDIAGITTKTPLLVKHCTENPKIKLRDALVGMNKQ